MPNQIQKKAGAASIDALAVVFPQNFPIAVLRDEGIRSNRIANEVELEGDIYAVVPGSDRAYKARKAIVSWITPMDVQPLGVENKKGKEGTDLRLGKLEFKGHTEPQKKAELAHPFNIGYDPNIVLYTAQGEVRINQALGVPQFYVRDCKILYKR